MPGRHAVAADQRGNDPARPAAGSPQNGARDPDGVGRRLHGHDDQGGVDASPLGRWRAAHLRSARGPRRPRGPRGSRGWPWVVGPPGAELARGNRGGHFSPASRAASVAITPSPPPLVTTRRRRPRGSGWLGETRARSKSSSTLRGRTAPACRRPLERDIGCEGSRVSETARPPSGERPALRRTTGLRAAELGALEEASAVGQPLEVGDDNVGFGIVRGGLETSDSSVGLVAERGEEREAHVGHGPSQDRARERARMGEERDPAAGGMPGRT